MSSKKKTPSKKSFKRTNAYKKASKASGRKEAGYVDLVASQSECDTTGSVVLVNTVAQGTSVTQRIGKRVEIINFQVKGHVFTNASATATFVQIALVYDKRPVGALPAVTDIFDTATSFAFAKDVGSPRFRILKRWTASLNGGAAAAVSGMTSTSIDEFVKLKTPLPLVCKSAGTGAIGDIEEGAVYLVVLGGNSAGTTDATSIISVRTRFIDV